MSYSSVIAALHEAGHVVEGALIGADVNGVTLHADGGLTRTSGTASMQIRISLAGHVAETMFAPGEVDVRCSRVDYEKAYTLGIQLARHEAHDALDREQAVNCGKRNRSKESARPAAKLSAVAAMSEQEIAEGIARLVQTWTVRAEVLVNEAEIEVRALLSANRTALFVVARALSIFGSLDGPQVRGLMRGALQSEDESRRSGRRDYA